MSRLFWRTQNSINKMLFVTRFQLRIYSFVNRIQFFGIISYLFFLRLFYFFLEPFFVIDKLSKELEQTDLISIVILCQLFNRGVIKDISCKPFGELKIVLPLCSQTLHHVSFDTSLRYFTRSTFRRSCSSPRSKCTKHSLRKRTKVFGHCRMNSS